MWYASYVCRIWNRWSSVKGVFKTEYSVLFDSCIWYINRKSEKSTSVRVLIIYNEMLSVAFNIYIHKIAKIMRFNFQCGLNFINNFLKLFRIKFRKIKRMTKYKYKTQVLAENETEKKYLKTKDVPHWTLSVLYCINMWCILRTFPRSTLHSAVVPFADIVHCPPRCDRSDLRPSTANSAPHKLLWKGFCCHTGFLNARFSVKGFAVDFSFSLIYKQ